MKLILFALLATAVGLPKNFHRYELPSFEKQVFYDAVKPLDKGDGGETAIIIIHGWNGGGKFYKSQYYLDKNLEKQTYTVAPLFPRVSVLKSQGIEVGDRATWNYTPQEDAGTVFDPAHDWRGGGDADNARISSFEVIDRILDILSDVKLYPNLKRIVLTGFSAGGQFVDRYVAVGRAKVRKGIVLDFVSMSPSTNLHLDKKETWHYGLARRPRYSKCVSMCRIMANLSSRNMLRGCGDEDVTERFLDMSAQAVRQGQNRFDRFNNLKKYISAYPKWDARTSWIVFEGIAHDNPKVYSYPVLLEYFRTGKLPASTR